jgi:hypothetical protein
MAYYFNLYRKADVALAQVTRDAVAYFAALDPLFNESAPQWADPKLSVEELAKRIVNNSQRNLYGKQDWFMLSILQLNHRTRATVVSSQEIDILLCQMLNEPVDAVNWAHGWVDTIGLRIAMGNYCLGGTKEQDAEFQAQFQDASDGSKRPIQKILAYLQTHFSSDSYYSVV